MFKVLWNLECPVGLRHREICVHFNEGNLAQFGRSTEKHFVELRSVFEFSRPKVAHVSLGFLILCIHQFIKSLQLTIHFN